MNNDNLEKPLIFKEYLINKESVYFDVPGKPFGKQRPRARRLGNFVSIYTPNETKKYEEQVRRCYKKIYGDLSFDDNDITVEIEGYFIPLKTATKSQQELMLQNKLPHTKKPDCDNMAKVCLDALNGVAYNDDASITDLIISKKFAKEAKVRITIIKNPKTEIN